ncbi:hypothetical protein Tsubulata_043909 [Turnera subulata]|uniref:F-box domain-containing protein n=1 Tax=Turnera subulata TaxID=218843 RepID=A0A9Q0FEK6_9ROSI|nr:hypothetical protein Tsubulata_043909 [Turnera subulata]
MGNPKKELDRGAKRNAEDRISSLPDDIIHYILSFLEDTKFAAKTCVLSKRWKNLWTSLPDLRFNTAYYKTTRSFRKFLLSALLRRDRNCEARSLHLSMDYEHLRVDEEFDDNSDEEGYYYVDDDESLRDYVFRYAARHGVRFVDYRHRRYSELSLPSALMDCHTLTTLNLYDLSVTEMPFLYFPAVTSLYVDGCNFGWKCFNVTESSFPNLAYLHIYNLLGGGHMQISGTKLVTFKMEGVQFNKVKLSAPNLEVFECRDTIDAKWRRLGDFFDIDLPSLQTAEVVVNYKIYHVSEQVEDKLMKLLDGIRNAKSLTLNLPPLKGLIKAGLLKHQTSPFSNLKSLKFLVKKKYLPGGCISRNRAHPQLQVPEKIKTYLLSGTPHPQNVDITLEDEWMHKQKQSSPPTPST